MTEITKEELIEISQPSAVYTNKFYFTQNNSMIKITCCEQTEATMSARFCMVMSIMEFQVFVEAVNNKMTDINAQIESFKAQTK